MGREEVLECFHFLNRVILATSEEDQPRLRPVTLIHLDGRFLITTGTKSSKVDHILKNPKVEFLLLLPEEGNTGYTIIELEPVEYDYMRPGDFSSTIIPA
jgi:uncharacterized pyridoxamine 5'-phosphate oxidase family protein